MATKALTRPAFMPSLIEDFFKPFNQWFDDSGLVRRINTIPAVNITENKDFYTVSLAAPGLTKEDFKIAIEDNMLTISSQKEEKKEEKEHRFTRQEYSFTSFTRSFTMPVDVKPEAIEARYENGVLNIQLPRKEETKEALASKRIALK